MRRRFRVIEGGARASALQQYAAEPTTWRIDLVRPCDVSEDQSDAWRGLLTRLGSHNSVFADPDYLVPAAQHQARGQDLFFAFAVAEGRHERLEGVVCLAMSRPFWGRNRAWLWKPAGMILAPAVNPDHASAIAEALGLHLRERGWNGPTGFSASAEPKPNGFGRNRPAYAVLAPERDIPLRNLLAVRAEARLPTEPTRVTRIVEPDLIRDGVEQFLGLDARLSPRPIIADPSEAAMVRVVTRLFARRRQATVEIIRRADRIVGSRLRLGHGPNAVLWKQVHERSKDAADDVADGRIAG